MPFTLEELAKHVGGQILGDKTCIVNSVATLQQARPGQISFLTNSAYKDQLATTQASAVILSQDVAAACPVNAIVVRNPHVAYARIAQLLYPEVTPAPGCHPTAVIEAGSVVSPLASIGPYCVIESGATIEAGVLLGPHCSIGRNVHIGEDSQLVANVVLCHGVHIGKRALIHPGAVIGADGFGQANDQGHWIKVPQVGKVVIGDDVEIGACTTIDRGAIEDTVIENGARLDNLIQIAHNVRIGADTVIAACVGIAGSTHIGKRCMIGGAAGVAGHLRITDGVIINAMAMVIKDITSPGVYSSGMPAEESRQWNRTYVRIKQLEDLMRRVKALERQLDTTK